MLDSAHARLMLLVCSLLPVSACAQARHAPASAAPGEPVHTESADDQRVALESSPSAAAAALLPSGARYRLVATAEQIALVVVGPDGRISGRLRIRPLDRADAGYGSTIVIDDFGGPEATIDAWSSPGGLCGEATVGGRRAAWQVRVDPDGSLAGESWSVGHGSHSLELEELRRARAIGADIAVLATELMNSGAIAFTTERELTELVMLADLALELSVRAWDGRGRASLPRMTSAEQSAE
jgi:hypothetical protein